MNRINQKIQEKKNILSIYFTAGFPNLEDTVPIIKELEKSGVDMIEIGLPFSDPLADGPTIQESSTIALKNGMNTTHLLNQLQDIRKEVEIPLIIMGYFNPILQFGVENFCRECNRVGIDGLIIPDLPIDVFKENYRSIFEKYGLLNIFLITPQTSEQRIGEIDELSKGFIYMVSSATVTGTQNAFGTIQTSYFERVQTMNLKSPQMIGFGISNAETFRTATKYANGAIIGSAFIKFIRENPIDHIPDFVEGIKNQKVPISSTETF